MRRAAFIRDSRMLLERMENALLDLAFNGQESGEEPINIVLRSSQDIRQAAEPLALGRIVALTHAFEHAFNSARAKGLSINKDLLRLLLACCDHISEQLSALERGALDTDNALHARGVPLFKCLHKWMSQLHVPGQQASSPC
jgi:two-component system, chemotaxis family, sensor kinase CheA